MTTSAALGTIAPVADWHVRASAGGDGAPANKAVM
jgi:hypothetical protein